MEPVVWKKNIEISPNNYNQVKKIIEFLTLLTDTSQKYIGLKRLENYFSENHLFERIPLKYIIYNDEFNFWNNDKISFKKGNNYKILEDFIDIEISKGNKKINIPKEIIKIFKKYKADKYFSGDLLVSAGPNNEMIVDPGIGSSRCGKLIGRFLSLYPNITDVTHFLTSSLNDSNAVIAEVRYIFEDEKFNEISNNPNVYEYAINLNTDNDESKINLSIDTLSVGLDNRGLYLWSEKLNKEVIPQFTNAVNGIAVNNRIYKFLYMLSRSRYEDFKPVIPDYFENRTWYPRIEYDGIIICREKWRLDKQFSIESKNNWENAFERWKNRVKIPSIIGVSLGEAPIIYDLENPLHLKLLKKLSNKKGESQISFVEVPEITNWKEKSISQDIYSFFSSNQVHTEINKDLYQYRTDISKNLVNNKMISIVIYPSLYMINPLIVIRNLLAKMVDDNYNFFFIQYVDEQKRSLRIRFWNYSNNFLNRIIKKLNKEVNSKEIYGYKINNFMPEYSRYSGKELFETSLKVFQLDSKVALKIADMEKEDQELAAIYTAIAMLKKMEVEYDALLTALNISSKEINKHSLVSTKLDNFKKKYGNFCSEFDKKVDYYEFQKYKGLEKNKYYSVAVSFLHMHFNRFLGPSRDEEEKLNINILEYMKMKLDKEKYGC